MIKDKVTSLDSIFFDFGRVSSKSNIVEEPWWEEVVAHLETAGYSLKPVTFDNPYIAYITEPESPISEIDIGVEYMRTHLYLIIHSVDKLSLGAPGLTRTSVPAIAYELEKILKKYEKGNN
ncbi:hypothetical protein JXC34_00955 [Candidatus Woesearchaeota archaeon]|nr:hypothetical protein [Candidatus Woesearchaeota archaeon]